MKIWDYIIIGAGSSGCVLANRLSESGEKSVLLIEAGVKDRAFGLKVPAGIGHAKTIEKNDWHYYSQPDPTRNNKTEHWLRGRVVGGSSSINGMMYVRGAASDYDRWAAMGNKGWAAKDVMPLFEAMECSDKKSPDRGSRGPLCIKTVWGGHGTTDAFIAASRHAGFQFNPDYNGTIQEGVSYAELTQRGGLRCSAADAFLKPALQRKNLTLCVGALVHKLQIENQRVTSICYEQYDEIHNVRGRKVVLCAGAINTPQLLMLSGVGDSEALSALGINPVINRPAVGMNLREHPICSFVFKMKAPTNNPTEGLKQKLRFLRDYLLRGQGPISTVFEATAFLKTRKDELYPDIQLHFMPIGASKNELGGFSTAPYPAVTVSLNKSHPLSTGQIRLNSADPRDAPLIECRLLDNVEDIATLVRGAALVRRIMETMPMAELIAEEVAPGASCTDTQSLVDYIRNTTGIAYHPVGTCRMGSDEEAVVTPDLKVRGINNLWVADASIMPDLISGNTNAVCMMIGEKLGQLLRK